MDGSGYSWAAKAGDVFHSYYEVDFQYYHNISLYSTIGQQIPEVQPKKCVQKILHFVKSKGAASHSKPT